MPNPDIHVQCTFLASSLVLLLLLHFQGTARKVLIRLRAHGTAVAVHVARKGTQLPAFTLVALLLIGGGESGLWNGLEGMYAGVRMSAPKSCSRDIAWKLNYHRLALPQ